MVHPKIGGELRAGTKKLVRGGSVVSLGQPMEGPGSYTDWTVLVRKIGSLAHVHA